MIIQQDQTDQVSYLQFPHYLLDVNRSEVHAGVGDVVVDDVLLLGDEGGGGGEEACAGGAGDARGQGDQLRR